MIASHAKSRSLEVASPEAQQNIPRKRPHALVVTFGPIVTPEGGWGVRARSLVDALSELGLRTSVISTDEPAVVVPSSIDSVHVLSQKLRLGWSRELVRAVRAGAREVDVMIVASALLLPAVRAGRPNAPVVWDTSECETLHYARLSPTLNHRLRGFVWSHIERWAVGNADLTIAISEIELEWWARLFPASRDRLAFVPHRSLAKTIVDGDARRSLELLCSRPLGGPVLLFVGNLVGKHNLTAAEWLVRELAPVLPAECTLVLAGPGTETLGVQDRIRDRVLTLGAVPDIDVVIAGADLCLAPLAAGAGVKTKVLDYLAHGKIVIATPVAAEGLEGAPGVDIVDLGSFGWRVLDHLAAPEDLETRRRRTQRQSLWLGMRHSPERVAAMLSAALARVGVQVP